MAYAMNDRVREQVSGFAGGTGALTLTTTAVSGFQSFLSGWGASGTGEYAIVSGAQWEVGYGTLNAGGTTLTRTTPYNGSSGAGVAVNFTAGTLDVFGDIPARTAKSLPAFAGDFVLLNGRINCTVGSSALTIAIKTSANTDPTAADPVYVVFRNATIATGDYTVLAVTAANSLVVSSGSTLGTVATIPFRLQIVLFNDAGTLRLGVINQTTPGLVNEDAVASSTAEGGAGAADSANVFYTGTAVTSKAYRILGYLNYATGLGTAGTWSAVPTTTQLAGGTQVTPIIGHQEFTGSGTFTAPVNTTPNTVFKFIITGGGGGGGSATGVPSGGGGGGAGATCIVFVSGLTAGTGYTVTIGAAGTAGAAGGSGGGGGTSSVVINGTTYQSTGGSGGSGTTLANSATNPGSGGTATNGSLNVFGGDGITGNYITAQNSAWGGSGGASWWGGGGAGAYAGGAPGIDARCYGAGGGGSAIHTTAGAGKAGVVEVEWVL